MKLNIKKGDNVVVIAGKDKGKTGKVLEIASEGRVIVDGVNIVTKHQKPRSAKDKGGIIKKPAPVDMSNLMVVCASCGKATRVARKNIEGVNTRICKKCGAGLDKAFVKAVKKDAKKSAKAETETKETPAKTTKAKTSTTGAKKSTVSKSNEAKVKPTASKAKTQTAKSAGRGN